MTKHFEREVKDLEKDLLALCTLAEEAVFKAVKAIQSRDQKLAQEVIGNDSQLDRKEVELEESCLKLLALHQPVATDLRLVVSVLKINNDLERIGDLAANMASQALSLFELGSVEIPFNLEGMADKTVKMLRDSIDALVKMDVDLARQVCLADDEVDELNRQMYVTLYEELPKHPELSKRYVIFLTLSRNLERIADLATNIAEDIIYMIDGEIVRHRNFNK